MAIPTRDDHDLDVPSSSSRFLENSRRFRTEAETERARVRDRDNARFLQDLQGHLRSLDCVESVSKRIEDLAGELISESPGFHVARRFFDGRWMIELSVTSQRTDDDGRSVRELSRLAFLLSRTDGGRLLVEGHAMVRDHGLPAERHETSLCEPGDEEALDAFLDARFLEFARSYFGGEGLAARASS